MPLLLSTAYLPSISYISGCLYSQQVIIERFETYQKQTSRNRCRIYGPNGLQNLSIPVIRINGSHTIIKDIRISKSIPWQRLHWRSIETAYNNSPFFLYYKDDFIKVFERPFDFLIDLNTHLFSIVLGILRINPDIGYTDQYQKTPKDLEDHRESTKKQKMPPDDTFPSYTQVFSEKHGFIADLSIIDLIFNLGPDSLAYLVSEKKHTFVPR